LVSFYETAQVKVCFAWIVSFFETNQVITGEEEEGLDDSVVTLLVSCICCGADTRAFIQISRRSFLTYGYYLQATVVRWDMGHWYGREGNTAVGVAICFVWWSTGADSMSKLWDILCHNVTTSTL